MKIAKNTIRYILSFATSTCLQIQIFKNYLKEQQLKILSDGCDIVNSWGMIALATSYKKSHSQ